MGRLENFTPRLEKFKIEEGGGIAVVHFEGHDSFPLGEDTISFIKQVNGHLSLQEIFLFLNGKGEPFSIHQSLELLKHLANMGVLHNADDFFQVIHSTPSGKKRTPKASRLDEKYFSHERLVALIQRTTLFLHCDRATADAILSKASLEKAEPDFTLIRKGTKSGDFFVMLVGEAGVYRDDECLATLGPLAVFGESAAILGQLRNADVKTQTDAWILRINATQLVDIESRDAFDAYKGLKSRLILNQTLAANPLFRGLPTDVMQFFISKCRIEKYGREQVVVEQGELSGDFYVILKGSVTIVRDGMPVSSLKEGNHFGEVAAMFNQPRTASVICETACTFLVLNQKALMEVLVSHFRLAVDIEKTAKFRRKSKSNILQIFDEADPTTEDTVITAEDDIIETTNPQTVSNIMLVDQDFLEASQSNFDLELVDFSKYEVGDEDDEDSV